MTMSKQQITQPSFVSLSEEEKRKPLHKSHTAFEVTTASTSRLENLVFSPLQQPFNFFFEL